MEEKPDVVIIDVGTNSLKYVKPEKIASEELEIVSICQKYGVNNVFLSAITYRETLPRCYANENFAIHGNTPVGNVNNIIIDSHIDYVDPYKLIRDLKLENINRLIIGHLNINSLRFKFEHLKKLIQRNFDIFVITESKLDKSIPSQEFAIYDYSFPNIIDRNANGGGVLIYGREDIPCKQLKINSCSKSFEGLFLDINLRKTKWLLFSGYRVVPALE